MNNNKQINLENHFSSNRRGCGADHWMINDASAEGWRVIKPKNNSMKTFVNQHYCIIVVKVSKPWRQLLTRNKQKKKKPTATTTTSTTTTTTTSRESLTLPLPRDIQREEREF